MRLKNLKFIILIAICVLSIASMSSCGKAKTKKLLDFYPKPDGTYAVSIGNARYLDEIVIPKKHNGKAVTDIAQGGFQSAPNLESVVIPDTVTTIGPSAFSSCEKLTTITIPDSVTKIDNTAFASCTKLADISIPNSVTTIGDTVFYNCYSLTSIIIPDSVTSLGNRVFYNCRYSFLIYPL